MAAIPDYVVILLEGSSEDFDPGVIRSEMERGLAKMRVAQSRVVVDQTAILMFRSAADSLAFEDWYFNTIKRIGFFDVYDPRAQMTRSVRFKGGSIGKLEPLMPGYVVSRRSVTLEYLK